MAVPDYFIEGLPEYLLVHTATPLSYEEPQGTPATWVEGEPGPSGGGEPVQGDPFPCVLFLPSPGGEVQSPYRPRVVREPTMLYNIVRDEDGTTVMLSNEDELLIDAPELVPWTEGVNPARWQLVGDSQGFGPPGSIMGAMATLRMVRD